MTINRNSNPYYDDFSEDKAFYQILFRPGFSVQARELTQLQSILRDQIAKFGGHVFKHGSVVIPGNSNSDLNICYVKIDATLYDVTSLEGKYVTGGTTGLKALIRKGIAAEGSDPATLFVSYYNSGTSGEKVFANGEVLTVTGVVTTFTTASSAACGASSMAFINKGVFFVNGTFVTCLPQSIVISKYSATPSAHVLLKIEESIVNSDDDSSLLDPAQGSYNYAAPGADRLKISLTLKTLTLGSAIGDDYIEIMRYNEGVLEEHLRYPKYNELAKNLARRTYDESGDYVVNGLETTVREHLKSDVNNGRYSAPTGDADKMLYTVSAGKAYIRGFENENISSKELVVDKARGSEHISVQSVNLNPSYAQYFYVSDLVNLPNFGNRTVVNLVDSWPAGSNVIGTARVLAIDYLESNTTQSNAIFKLFVHDVIMSSGDIADVGGINWSGGSCSVLNKYSIIPNNSTNFVMDETITYATRTAKVRKYIRDSSTLYAYKNTTLVDSPVIGDTVTAGSGAGGRIVDSEILTRNANDSLLVELPTSSTYRVKNSVDVSDMSYKTYHEATVTITGGAGSFSVTGMTIDPAEQGSFLITSAAGVHPYTAATVAVDGLSVSFAGISPSSTTIKVLCAATKAGASNGAPRTKTLVLGATESGVAVATTITLTKADIIRIQSIVSTTMGDVTDRFTFDNGQRDYGYMLGTLYENTGGVSPPTGTLTITYDYFNHNPGDYFSIDSYESSGLTDYYDSPLLTYKSKATGKEYDLRNVLDFRPRAGAGNSFTGAGAVINEVVQNDSRISSSVKHYVGRVDAVLMDKSGDLLVISGTPGENPRVPSIPAESLYLAKVNVPPYTFKSSDVLVEKQDNRVYTMKDVGKLDKKLTNLEDYVLLNSIENAVVNEEIIDAKTGLSRFKSGYLVDTFLDPDSIANIDNPAFKVAYQSGNIVPQFEVFEADLEITTNDGTTTGNAITLPYTHSVLAKQPVSSKITNINPFSVFSWTGTMTLTPANDTWTEVEQLSAIVNTETETVLVRRNFNAWLPTTGAGVSFEPFPLPVDQFGNSNLSLRDGTIG